MHGTIATTASAAAQGYRSEPALEWGHHLSPHHRARDLALPLFGDRCLESESGGLGGRRERRSQYRSGTGAQGLPERADQ